ncbi:T9SS type A sorting domain-containing protein, partial [Crocinitomix catalasitica]|nr:T9SS type A sorting domain-containing protein [Crocinitomix catalasitica]
SSGSYNFGIGNIGPSDHFESIGFRRTTAVIDGLETISGTGQVFINEDNRIGLITTEGGPFTKIGTPTEPTEYTVFLQDCGIAPTLEVELGGLLHIGVNENQTGILQILDGGRLEILDGGDVFIRENSKIIINDGARMVISDGGRVFNFGNIIVKEGGILEYQDGAEINMNNTESEIHLDGGQILLGPNANFTIDYSLTESGIIRVSGCCNENVIGSTSNTSFQLDGIDENDIIMEIEKAADFWVSDDLDFVNIKDGQINFADDARLVSIPNYFTSSVTYSGVPTDRGLDLFNLITVANCIFNDVHINAYLQYKGTGDLDVINSEFNIPGGDRAIYVWGQDYFIFNTTFTGDPAKFISSNSLNGYSSVASCTFNSSITTTDPITIGVFDISNATVSARNNIFNDCRIGINKNNGKLDARCNEFSLFTQRGIEAGPNCYLQMGSSFEQGYNKFQKASAFNGVNIFLNNALYMQLKYGYNTFDDVGTFPIIAGTVQIGPTDKQHVHFHKNIWRVDEVPTIPSPTRFIITSSITGSPISTVTVDPENALCGAFDPSGSGGSVFAVGPGGENGSKKISTPHFDDVKVIDALNQTLSEMEAENPQNGDDLFALELFSEILTASIKNPNKITNFLLEMSGEYMSNVLHHAYTGRNITRDGNQQLFDQSVQHYVDALNFLSSENLDENNYVRRFYLEMEKAHLFHLLGDVNLALLILYNTESCGLNEPEQRYLNEWKFHYEVEIAKLNYGFMADTVDTVWVDSSRYVRPTTQEFGEFGSEILDRNSIDFFNCFNPKSMLQSSLSQLSIYPNPSQGIYTVTYTLDDYSYGSLTFAGLDGKVVYTHKCKSGTNTDLIDLSKLSSGVYIYTLKANGLAIESGKIIKH